MIRTQPQPAHSSPRPQLCSRGPHTPHSTTPCLSWVSEHIICTPELCRPGPVPEAGSCRYHSWVMPVAIAFRAEVPRVLPARPSCSRQGGTASAGSHTASLLTGQVTFRDPRQLSADGRPSEHRLRDGSSRVLPGVLSSAGAPPQIHSCGPNSGQARGGRTPWLLIPFGEPYSLCGHFCAGLAFPRLDPSLLPSWRQTPGAFQGIAVLGPELTVSPPPSPPPPVSAALKPLGSGAGC